MKLQEMESKTKTKQTDHPEVVSATRTGDEDCERVADRALLVVGVQEGEPEVRSRRPLRRGVPEERLDVA